MKIFGDNVLSLYICTQTIKGFYVYLLSSFYIGVRSFVKSTGSSFFLISRVRPVHSFFEKKSILENTSQIFTNLFFSCLLKGNIFNNN